MEPITYIAPVNIAVIKYWGKRDEDLILPINSSLSVTLDTKHLCAKTTVMISPNFKEDKIWLNGCEQTMDNARLQNCLREVKKKSRLSDQKKSWKIHICSENNFPTAAGLASSAAGYACLAAALSQLFEITDEKSSIARIGSGSACRSMYGGFVKWNKGVKSNGEDSIASLSFPSCHWPQMRILILVVNDVKKKVSSAEGMKRTMLTTPILKFRSEKIVPLRMEQIENAILNRDFKTFAELTMKDSNEMHAACLAAYPPCIYLNHVSHGIIELVHAYNSASGLTKAAYTFDAGPNATLLVLEEHIGELYAVINHFFPIVQDLNVNYQKGIPINETFVSQELLDKINFQRQTPGKFKYVIHTRIGEGPQQIVDPSQHLLNNKGLPKDIEL